MKLLLKHMTCNSPSTDVNLPAPSLPLMGLRSQTVPSNTCLTHALPSASGRKEKKKKKRNSPLIKVSVSSFLRFERLTSPAWL